MKFLLPILLVLLFTAQSFGQSPKAGAKAAGNSKTDDIMKVLEMTGSAEMAKQVLIATTQQFKKGYPNVPEKFWDDFAKGFNKEELLKKLVPVYDKNFTHEDIKQLIQFYESPIGQKTIKTMPAVMQESMEIGQVWGKEIAEKVISEMKKKNY